MLDDALIRIKRLIPSRAFRALQRPYHLALAATAALWYRFPSRRIAVVAVTGTKGKSTTTEIVNAILEAAGKRTALSNTIRFKVADRSWRNLYKMSMPGRFAMQRLIRQAVDAGCEYFVCEMTSQGSLLHRHRFIAIDALIFTNLTPEHIEAHGSYEAYVQAKLDIARALAHSGKRTAIVANADDAEAPRFLACAADAKLTYSLKDGFPYATKLRGDFNRYNILAAAAWARHAGIPEETIARAIASFEHVPGRVEKVSEGQDFEVVVDYAHTPDSLEKLYRVFEGRDIVAVLGGTGGGRDAWKRAEMGRLADRFARAVVLTDEDPYDEDPEKIVADVAAGIASKRPEIVMDRRAAIR